MSYHYFGLVLGKTKATVTLLHVVLMLAGSHAAVWLGASHATSRWVQAGVEMQSGDRHPYLYIETNAPRRSRTFQSWPIRDRQASRVMLLERGGCWRVRAGGHVSRWVWVPQAHLIATLELFGTFFDRAAAAIDGRVASGRG